MAADASALLALNCCLGRGYSEKELLAMSVQLLASIASMAANPDTLLALNCCLGRGYSERELMAMMVQLLQGVVDGGGGGGGAGDVQVYTGAAPPAAPDNPALPALYYPTGGGTLSQWDGAAWV